MELDQYLDKTYREYLHDIVKTSEFNVLELDKHHSVFLRNLSDKDLAKTKFQNQQQRIMDIMYIMKTLVKTIDLYQNNANVSANANANVSGNANASASANMSGAISLFYQDIRRYFESYRTYNTIIGKDNVILNKVINNIEQEEFLSELHKYLQNGSDCDIIMVRQLCTYLEKG